MDTEAPWVRSSDSWLIVWILHLQSSAQASRFSLWTFPDFLNSFFRDSIFSASLGPQFTHVTDLIYGFVHLNESRNVWAGGEQNLPNLPQPAPYFARSTRPVQTRGLNGSIFKKPVLIGLGYGLINFNPNPIRPNPFTYNTYWLNILYNFLHSFSAVFAFSTFCNTFYILQHTLQRIFYLLQHFLHSVTFYNTFCNTFSTFCNTFLHFLGIISAFSGQFFFALFAKFFRFATRPTRPNPSRTVQNPINPSRPKSWVERVIF